MSKHVSFRIDDGERASLVEALKSSKRSQTDEVKAALHVYFALLDLASLKASLGGSDGPSERNYIGEDYRLKSEAMAALLPSVPGSVRSAYEEETGKALDDSVGSFEGLVYWALGLDPSGEFEAPGR